MDLIKNVKTGKWNEKIKFCKKCSNKGKIKVVQECDSEKFSKLYDKYYDRGGMTEEECYDVAIEQCRYDEYYCPDCEMGQKYKDKYPVYFMEF